MNFNTVNLIEEHVLAACNFMAGKLLLWTVIGSINKMFQIY